MSGADGFAAWLTVRGELEQAVASVGREPLDALVARFREATGRVFFTGRAVRGWSRRWPPCASCSWGDRRTPWAR